MDLEKITEQVRDLSEQVGSFIINEWDELSSENVEKKGVNDFVTYVDKTSEEKLVRGLREILPEAGFIVEEETTGERGSRYDWIVDPLDGTTNYIHGIKPFSISIALAKDKEIILGLVNELRSNEIYKAWSDSQAYLNGTPIKVSGTASLEESLLATGFPFTNFSRLESYMKLLKHFMRNSHGIRRFGSAAADLCYTAGGRFEAFFEYSLKPWDVAAGSFILKQAGGKVSDFSGGNGYLFNQEIVAANSKVFNRILQDIKSYMIDNK
ncbi:MAG: inositol monophosphatase [Bacteroidales bacterium]|nr:inositol monophosphatase [Bacteroidales bacterium]